MENASKALIIAGAILISILLIGVGVAIYQRSMDPINEANNSMSDQEKQIFNQKFEDYAGQNVRGSTVKSLISAIIANNGTYSEEDDKKVELVYSGAQGESAIRNAIKNTAKYNVDLEYENGIVNKVTITDVSGKSSGTGSN